VAEGQNNVKRQEPDGSINKPDPTTRLRQFPMSAGRPSYCVGVLPSFDKIKARYISGIEVRRCPVTVTSDTLTLTVRRRPVVLVLAWVSCVAMLAMATSIVGLFVAPLAVPTAIWLVTRRTAPWAVRLPLIIGSVALLLLFGAWLISGAEFGSTTGGGSSA
jgi:hypothetical protein